MNQREIEENLELLVDTLFTKITTKLGSYLESLTLVGSYAVGTYSLSRPDINFMIIFKETVGGKEHLILGEIFSELFRVMYDFSH